MIPNGKHCDVNGSGNIHWNGISFPPTPTSKLVTRTSCVLPDFKIPTDPDVDFVKISRGCLSSDERFRLWNHNQISMQAYEKEHGAFYLGTELLRVSSTNEIHNTGRTDCTLPSSSCPTDAPLRVGSQLGIFDVVHTEEFNGYIRDQGFYTERPILRTEVQFTIKSPERTVQIPQELSVLFVGRILRVICKKPDVRGEWERRYLNDNLHKKWPKDFREFYLVRSRDLFDYMDRHNIKRPYKKSYPEWIVCDTNQCCGLLPSSPWFKHETGLDCSLEVHDIERFYDIWITPIETPHHYKVVSFSTPVRLTQSKS